MTTNKSTNYGVSRDATFDNLRSRRSDRVPVVNTTTLTTAVPPGSREEGNLIYNQNNDTIYLRNKVSGVPAWSPLLTGSSVPVPSLAQVLRSTTLPSNTTRTQTAYNANTAIFGAKAVLNLDEDGITIPDQTDLVDGTGVPTVAGAYGPVGLFCSTVTTDNDGNSITLQGGATTVVSKAGGNVIISSGANLTGGGALSGNITLNTPGAGTHVNSGSIAMGTGNATNLSGLIAMGTGNATTLSGLMGMTTGNVTAVSGKSGDISIIAGSNSAVGATLAQGQITIKSGGLTDGSGTQRSGHILLEVGSTPAAANRIGEIILGKLSGIGGIHLIARQLQPTAVSFSPAQTGSIATYSSDMAGIIEFNVNTNATPAPGYITWPGASTATITFRSRYTTTESASFPGSARVTVALTTEHIIVNRSPAVRISEEATLENLILGGGSGSDYITGFVVNLTTAGVLGLASNITPIRVHYHIIGMTYFGDSVGP